MSFLFFQRLGRMIVSGSRACFHMFEHVPSFYANLAAVSGHRMASAQHGTLSQRLDPGLEHMRRLKDVCVDEDGTAEGRLVSLVQRPGLREITEEYALLPDALAHWSRIKRPDSACAVQRPPGLPFGTICSRQSSGHNFPSAYGDTIDKTAKQPFGDNPVGCDSRACPGKSGNKYRLS